MLFTPLDITFTCLHSVSGTLGIIGNIALLAALKFRSPPTWRSYTILLANCALIDLAACCSSSFSIERFVPFKEVTMSVYLGPCIYISGFVCHVFHSIMLHTLMHSLVLVVSAFCYRLYVIGRPAPSTAKMLLFCVVVYLPTLSVVIMTFFTNDPSEAVRVALRDLHPEHEQFEEYVVEGHVDIQPHLLARLLQAYIILPIVPLIILVFIVRHKVIGKLKAKEDVMTTRTREMHKSLIKVLTLQASLPILFLASVISFILVKRQIYDSAFLEYSIFLYVSFMPTIAPYITLYNVTPFRNFVLCRPAPRVTHSMSTITAVSSFKH